MTWTSHCPTPSRLHSSKRSSSTIFSGKAKNSTQGCWPCSMPEQACSFGCWCPSEVSSHLRIAKKWVNNSGRQRWMWEVPRLKGFTIKKSKTIKILQRKIWTKNTGIFWFSHLLKQKWKPPLTSPPWGLWMISLATLISKEIEDECFSQVITNYTYRLPLLPNSSLVVQREQDTECLAHQPQ